MPTPVLAAIVQRGDSYLVCQRPAHKRHGSLWEFPGGKLEPGETYFDAVDRELTEELAVRALSIGDVLFSVVDAGSDFQIDFVPTTIEGEPQCLEHAALRWVPRRELKHLDLAPSDRRFVEVALSDRSEST